jgi:hypothetical protein
MAKKKALMLPKAMCDVPNCTQDAAYGFRETIDVSSSTISDFIMGDVPNWCKAHDTEMRMLYANKVGKFVGPL